MNVYLIDTSPGLNFIRKHIKPDIVVKGKEFETPSTILRRKLPSGRMEGKLIFSSGEFGGHWVSFRAINDASQKFPRSARAFIDKFVKAS